MKDIILRKMAVEYLAGEYKKIQQSNYSTPFPAKLVSDSVGGSAGRLGIVANLVVEDLKAMGISCKYDKRPNPKVFILTSS